VSSLRKAIKTGLLVAAICLACRGSLTARAGIPQDSSSQPSPALSGAAGGPIAALRDALSAACSQSERSFTKFLTVRNAETFAGLTPAARVALMKRFVLLDEPGKASAITSPSGRPIVHCETPDGAAELQIGGAELSDNLAFLPVEVRDATDTVGNNVMHIKMGMVRENGEWKLLSVGLVLLDLPSLAVEWDAAEIESTERAAISGLKTIADAVEAYRRTYTRLPESLAQLGPPAHGAVSADAAGLLDPELASGAKTGYVFRYVIAGAGSLGAPAKFELAATPQTYGRTGRRSFFRDSAGGLHGADRQGVVGGEGDPKVE
jgi:type IV pilus assembly protein PilA